MSTTVPRISADNKPNSLGTEVAQLPIQVGPRKIRWGKESVEVFDRPLRNMLYYLT